MLPRRVTLLLSESQSLVRLNCQVLVIWASGDQINPVFKGMAQGQNIEKGAPEGE